MKKARLAALTACALAALATAPAALAHARFVGSSPEDGAILKASPAEVRVLFDDAVRPASGIAAISNRTRESVLEGKPQVEAGGRRLAIGLKRDLPRGDYTVRWRVRSDDGHILAGVIAFRVGPGGGRPTAALSAGSGPSATDVLQRWLLFLGIALAAGGLAFHYLVWIPALRDSDGQPAAAGDEDDPGLASTIVASGFVLALLGLGHLHTSLDTRYDRANAIGAIAAVAGAVLAAIAWADRRARPFALVPAAVLLLVPAVRGHALDLGHSRPLAFSVDVVHLAAASIWIGGLVQLLAAAPGAGPPRFEHLARRFSAFAGVAVVVVAASGALRALTELTAVDELWTTSYGQAILVKTAIFVPLVAIGWVNRSRLLPALGRARDAIVRLRVNVSIEVVLLLGLLVAVAVLTAVAPGRLAEAPATTRPVARAKPVLPASRPGTLVLAREDGGLAVAVAARRAGERLDLTATVLGQDGLGVDGLSPRFAIGGAGAAASPCGSGCYRASLRPAAGARRLTLAVHAGDRPLAFTLPRLPARSGAALIRRVERNYRALRTVVIDEHLASGPGHAISTVFRLVAPDRMAYQIAHGPSGISIGHRRWDRDTPTSSWVASDQEPIPVPRPFWRSASNVSLVSEGRSTATLTFLDRTIPAWFELVVDRRTLRPRTLRMTAAAHFMRHRYGPFNAPIAVEPP